MQGTWIQTLVGENSTCHRATKPMGHNYWAPALEPANCNYWARTPYSPCSTREATAMRSPQNATKSDPCSPQLEKVLRQQPRCNAAKINKQIKRICLPMQGTRFDLWPREDPTCLGETKPKCHNYWAWTLQPMVCNKRSHCNDKTAQQRVTLTYNN